MKKQNFVDDAKNRAQKKLEYDLAENNSLEIPVAAKGAMRDSNAGLNVSPMEPNSTHKLNNQEVMYEEQYDPNQDFAIFGVSNNTKKGVDSLKDKVNKANVVESSEDEDSNPDHSTGEKISRSLSPANSATEFNGTGDRFVNPPSSGNEGQDNNALPENQEIADDDDLF